MFAEMYENHSDAQEAMNELNDNLDNLIFENSATYSLGTKDWYITSSADISKTNIESYISLWNEYYDTNIDNLDDLFVEIEDKVHDTMCNYGCDVLNVLTAFVKMLSLRIILSMSKWAK